MILALILSCSTGKVVIGSGEGAYDARFVTQVSTWECGGFETDPYPGTFGHEVILYHAPGSLSDLLPENGCEFGVDMFPNSAGEGAMPIEGLEDFPEWNSTVDSGEMQGDFGYWYEDVLTDEHTCDSPQELLEYGTVLENAAHFSGSATPAASEVPYVAFSGYDEESGVITWGDEVEASWETTEWDRIWIQMSRVREGDIWESVVCNVSDETSFTLSEDVWALMDEELNVEYNNLYVTFEKRDLSQTDSGHWIETISRVVSLAVIPN
jgi:hypothetical protein